MNGNYQNDPNKPLVPANNGSDLYNSAKSNKWIIVIVVIILAIAIWYFFFRKSNMLGDNYENPTNPITDLTNPSKIRVIKTRLGNSSAMY